MNVWYNKKSEYSVLIAADSKKEAIKVYLKYVFKHCKPNLGRYIYAPIRSKHWLMMKGVNAHVNQAMVLDNVVL